MITVKHIGGDGIERVFAALVVEYKSYGLGDLPVCAQGYSQSTGRVMFVVPQSHTIGGDRTEYVYDGSVYVMNEVGKTVAKYDLGGWAQPQTMQADPRLTKGTFTQADVGATFTLSEAKAILDQNVVQ